MFNPKIPFDIPMLPTNFDFNQVEILKLALKASNAISKLNWLILVLPNPELLVKPLLSKESVESSAIENIYTTTTELLKSETINKNKLKWPEKEVTNYKDALLYGFNFIKNNWFIHTNLLVKIWDIIEPNKWWIRKIPGTVIANIFWETLYTPPVWETNIRNYLKNLEDFVNNFDDDIDPLIKVWVIHYQFESIHPFCDWNWRTWRVLMVLYLVLTQKLDYPILFLSEYINKNKTEYYKILNNTSKTWDYKDIIIFMLKAIEKQALITANKIIAINNLIKELNIKIWDEKIVKFIFSNPFISIKYMSENMWITRQTSSKYIKKLQELKLLESIDYTNTKLYFIPEFIKILS